MAPLTPLPNSIATGFHNGTLAKKRAAAAIAGLRRPR